MFRYNSDLAGHTNTGDYSYQFEQIAVLCQTRLYEDLCSTAVPSPAASFVRHLGKSELQIHYCVRRRFNADAQTAIFAASCHIHVVAPHIPRKHWFRHVAVTCGLLSLLRVSWFMPCSRSVQCFMFVMCWRFNSWFVKTWALD